MPVDDLQRVRDSFDRLGDARAFGRRFHDRLFALRPDLRRLFPSDLDAQAAKPVDRMAALIRRPGSPARPSRDCADLGRRHAACGVAEDDYADVGAALLQALHRTFGEAFTPELEQAWAAAYGEIAEAMIAASA